MNLSVAWPDRRGDVLNALDVLASEPPTLDARGQDPRWPDLSNAVHWLVDDTFWDHGEGARESIGTILRDENEADVVQLAVAAVMRVAKRQGPTSRDAAWFADEGWPEVRRAARAAAAVLRGS